MARRGWGGSIATALGVAAGTGAAQLGIGYGLGIINWAPAAAGRVEATWVASLAWATWISATSVVAGAICAHRLAGEDDEEPGGLPRKLSLAVAATVGALITVLLVAVPARAAAVPDTASPQAVAAGYAAVGLLVGLLLATWALRTRAAANNLIATTGWLWLLAVVSVVDGVLSGRGLTTAQLGIWQISADSERFWIRDYFYWPGALLSLGSALVIGVLAARRAVRVPERRIGAAASGAAGPLLVALAYLLAVPRLAAIAAEQVSAHLIAPYAVIAGVGGSVLVAALAQRPERQAVVGAGVSLPRQRTGELDDLATGGLDQPAVDAAAVTGNPTAVAGEPAVVAAVGPETPVAGPESTAPARGRSAARRGRTVPPQRPQGSSTGSSVPAASGTGTASRAAAGPTTGARSADPPATGDPTTEAPAGTTATGNPADGGSAPKARRRGR
ncbi:hypothetical protein [Micromonospora sp. SL4-19]|uniref:hypothetical protein n=1 Tax=Micromonospora sp. SL4-19 TaxID=3399129 RepID=UPI003A4DF40D